MARPRQFDIDEALDQALTLFWRQGYSATSVRELCSAMQIRVGSFYSAFERKETCFRMALQRYLMMQGAAAIKPGPNAVRAWFAAIIRPDRQPKGCLLVNSAAEHPKLDLLSQALVTGQMQALEDFFWLCLNHRPNARADAALLGAAVVGIHVLARSGAPPRRLEMIADRALQLLE